MTMIGQRIRTKRHAQAITAEQLAQRAGLTLGTVSRIERGANEPTVSSLTAIARALGTTVDDLIGAADPVATEGTR
jgi:transcriptional regulator with XRE-family HTH domain